MMTFREMAGRARRHDRYGIKVSKEQIKENENLGLIMLVLFVLIICYFGK